MGTNRKETKKGASHAGLIEPIKTGRLFLDQFPGRSASRVDMSGRPLLRDDKKALASCNCRRRRGILKKGWRRLRDKRRRSQSRRPASSLLIGVRNRQSIVRVACHVTRSAGGGGGGGVEALKTCKAGASSFVTSQFGGLIQRVRVHFDAQIKPLKRKRIPPR